jgi:D-aminoacyl-tRNA deacylase
MRALVQRVSHARVTVDGQVTGEIGPGLLVLLGVTHADTEAQATYLAGKIAGLRIFEDPDGKMNRSVVEAGGAVLAVPQFTLYGDCRKGRRPSFDAAARPDLARALFDGFVARVRALGVTVATGVFQAHMQVALVNDGPVTLMVET